MIQLRVDRLRKTMIDNNLDGFLVSNFHNIYYLSGFRTLTDDEREGWLLVTKNNLYLFSDSRYLNNNKIDKLLTFKIITPDKGLIKHLQEIVSNEAIKQIGVEGDDLTITEFSKLNQYLPKIKLIPTEKTLINIRTIKDKIEIDNIKKACELSDQCLSSLIPIIKPGVSEKDIAFKLDLWLKQHHINHAFYPIVAIDKNTSIPHYDTRGGDNRSITNQSILLIDFGAKYNHYLSDITRMIFIGKPSDEMINTYHYLLDSQQKTIDLCNQEKSCKNIDLYCRKLITDNQLPVYQHSTGHGVGLEIHEYPKISPVSVDSIIENQVFTIEPGVYFEGKWGMRIEDTVLIKGDKVEALTKFGKKPLIISN